MIQDEMSEEQAWTILELPPDSSMEDVRKGYRDIVKVWHPDRFPGDEKFKLRATRKMQEINTAYKVVQASFQSRDQGRPPEPASQPEGTPPSPPQTQTTEENGHPQPRTSTLQSWAEGSFWLIILIYLFFGSEPILLRLLLLGVLFWLWNDSSVFFRLGLIGVGLTLLSDSSGNSTHSIGVWSLLSFAGFGILKAVVGAYGFLVRSK